MTAFLQFCVNTLGYLRLMTVSDLIDIAILAFVFYKCIGIFQRTNAAKVAKALLIIVVAMWISYQFNLNAINFILSKAVELGLLALVVIFQPEIRRFLEKVGSNSVSGFSRDGGGLRRAVEEQDRCPDGLRAGDGPVPHHRFGDALPVHCDQ